MADQPESVQIEVECEGGPRAMGFAQGEALRDKIASARGALAQMEAFRLLQPWWLPFGAFRRLAERKACRFLRDPLQATLPEMADRLAGISAGAGARLSTVYLFNALESFMSSFCGGTVEGPPAACSALAVRGARSATGEPMVAHNFDYLPLVQPYYVLRVSRPRGGLRSLDFTAAPLGGTVDGINERGLCITSNYAFTTDSGPPAPPISMVVARALACCATVAEAAECIGACPRTGGGLLMLADAEGDLASLELSNTRRHVRRPANGEESLYHTNDFFCAAMREVEVSHRAVHTNTAPTPLRGRRVLESSECRARRFAHLLSGTGRLGPDELARLMADHGPTGDPDANSLCVHSSYWSTTACLQFLPRSRKIRVAYDAACRARYREFEV